MFTRALMAAATRDRGHLLYMVAMALTMDRRNIARHSPQTACFPNVEMLKGTTGLKSHL
jgi:hypothetical protein